MSIRLRPHEGDIYPAHTTILGPIWSYLAYLLKQHAAFEGSLRHTFRGSIFRAGKVSVVYVVTNSSVAEGYVCSLRRGIGHAELETVASRELVRARGELLHRDAVDL